MKTIIKLVCSVCLSVIISSQAHAFTWNEVGDAGQFPGSAQATTGTGALTQITGTIGFNTDVDMYMIFIQNPLSFVAEVTLFNVPNSTLFPNDSQLFLFNASGIFVAFDDDGGVGFLSKINPFSGPAGNYFLAISTYNNDPIPNTIGQQVAGWNNFSFATGPGNYQINLTGATAASVPSVTTYCWLILLLVGLYVARRTSVRSI